MSEMGGVDKVGDLRDALAYSLWRLELASFSCRF